MKIINIHEAKTNLSKYLEEVVEGGEIVIGKYGHPIARLVPFVSDKPKYEFGRLRGRVKIGDGFDEVGKGLSLGADRS